MNHTAKDKNKTKPFAGFVLKTLDRVIPDEQQVLKGAFSMGSTTTTHPSIQPEYLSLDDLAVYCSCSRRHLERQIASGRLTTYTVGGKRLSTRRDADRMMEQGKNKRPRRRIGPAKTAASV